MPRRSQVDEAAQRELELYTDNTVVFRRQINRAEELLARGICRRRMHEQPFSIDLEQPFSIDLAARVFSRVLLDAAREYQREIGPQVFSTATHRALAREYALDFKNRVNLFLKRGIRDITPDTQATLTRCNAPTLAGRRRYRRRSH